MKCIKENCRMPYMSGNTGFCHELETFIFGENPECPLPDKIVQMEEKLKEYNCCEECFDNIEEYWSECWMEYNNSRGC